MEEISQFKFNCRVRSILHDRDRRIALSRGKTSDHAKAYADKDEKAYLLVGAKKRFGQYSLIAVCDEATHHVITLEMCKRLELRPLTEDEFIISAWSKMFPGLDMVGEGAESDKFEFTFADHIIMSSFMSYL